MRKSGIYQYYVEGEDERSLLNTLKLDLRCIESGKIVQQLLRMEKSLMVR